MVYRQVDPEKLLGWLDTQIHQFETLLKQTPHLNLHMVGLKDMAVELQNQLLAGNFTQQHRIIKPQRIYQEPPR